MQSLGDIWTAYRLRLKRRRLLFRAFRKRRQLTIISDRTAQITSDDILGFSSLRNERVRLPHFLQHYRNLGVSHFLIVDNNSDDGTGEYLAAQPDVSLWHTAHSYKLARFGMDWLTWLLIRYGHGHWCLTVDADEILVYPHWDRQGLKALTRWLDAQQVQSFGALMIDMYPKGALDVTTYLAGQDPVEILGWFDGDNYSSQMQSALQNLWVQGGVRARLFFADRPERAPTLNKTPLVRWNRRFSYVSSTHSLLPRRLNHVFDEGGSNPVWGALLHTKFLHMVVDKSREEKQRQEHFANSELYNEYYDRLMANPDMWCEKSMRYTGWRQLEKLGLMSAGNWRP